MATQVRGLHGEIFNLDNEPDAVKHALEEDGVVVICQRSNITVPMNSLNRIQAMQVWGNLGYTTFEFLEKEIFMSAVRSDSLLSRGSYANDIRMLARSFFCFINDISWAHQSF